MADNGTDFVKVKRKIYTKEVLNAFRCSELSNLWPKILDKTCVNSHGQWDPVKSFDSTKPTDTKRSSYYENKVYRNNDKSKDDISLRPERRKWNDGCQVTNNKRNGDDSHSSSYRKAYQTTIPSNGGGDYDKRSFNRTINRGVKPRDAERDNKYNNLKSDKSSRNNSNLDDRKDDAEEQKYNFKGCNNTKSNEPEWFLNGPENCDETIELCGITATDSSIAQFKKDSSKMEKSDEHSNPVVKETEKSVINFTNERIVFDDACITSKREGSRFQDIFQKETKINNLKESKEVENIIKAVLSEKVSKLDAERLSDLSKPLPNGVLTVEEIEKGLTTSPMEFLRVASKAIDTLTSFEPTLNSLLPSNVANPIVDNSKVVNWLSNLNMSVKEPETEHKPLYPESQAFAMNNIMTPQMTYMPTNYSKFAANLSHPPGLPLMYNSGHLQSQQSLHHPLQPQQQSLQQQHQQLLQQQIQQQQQQSLSHLTLQHTQSMHQSFQNQSQMAYMKQMNNIGQSASMNMPHRNLPIMNVPHEAYAPDSFKLNSQLSLSNDAIAEQNLLSSVLLKNNVHMSHTNDRHSMLTMGAPPGLTNMSMLDKSMLMSRAIVKTNQPYMDFAQAPDFSAHYQNQYRRPADHCHTYGRNCAPFDAVGSAFMAELADSGEMHKPAHYGRLELLRGVRAREPMATVGGYRTTQQPMRVDAVDNFGPPRPSANKMLANLFNVNSTFLPPLPQQAKYADQIETENV